MAILTIKKEQKMQGAPIASWGASCSVDMPEFMGHILSKGFMSGSFKVIRLQDGNLEMVLTND